MTNQQINWLTDWLADWQANNELICTYPQQARKQNNFTDPHPLHRAFHCSFLHWPAEDNLGVPCPPL